MINIALFYTCNPEYAKEVVERKGVGLVVTVDIQPCAAPQTVRLDDTEDPAVHKERLEKIVDTKGHVHIQASLDAITTRAIVKHCQLDCAISHQPCQKLCNLGVQHNSPNANVNYVIERTGNRADVVYPDSSGIKFSSVANAINPWMVLQDLVWDKALPLMEVIMENPTGMANRFLSRTDIPDQSTLDNAYEVSASPYQFGAHVKDLVEDRGMTEDGLYANGDFYKKETCLYSCGYSADKVKLKDFMDLDRVLSVPDFLTYVKKVQSEIRLHEFDSKEALKSELENVKSRTSPAQRKTIIDTLLARIIMSIKNDSNRDTTVRYMFVRNNTAMMPYTSPSKKTIKRCTKVFEPMASPRTRTRRGMTRATKRRRLSCRLPASHKGGCCQHVDYSFPYVDLSKMYEPKMITK